MADEYHQLPHVSNLRDENELTIPRAIALAQAIARNRDFSVIQFLRHDNGTECIVVDVETDGVPPKSTVGIEYRERLVLKIPENPQRLIDVCALRKNFPLLMHQNQGVRGGLASLCLYFEPSASVTRTWTPEAFLRRIQWWLAQSATGELHPADQPVEQLFFASNYELVLPWNFAELGKDPNTRFVVVPMPTRPDEGWTCIVKAIPKAEAIPPNSVGLLHLDLSPVEHGFVERAPEKLGQLADVLKSRDVDLMGSLAEALRDRVSEIGVSRRSDDAHSIILMRIPLTRKQAGDPEKTDYRAIFVGAGLLTLGESTGALIYHDGKYFDGRGVMGETTSTAWRDELILPMDVRILNDAAAARQQSGLTDEGPNGVLVGVGSLGSAMLMLWERSGWGQWTVIDNDHVKPHNLSRHTAVVAQIGKSKVDAVAELHDLIADGASRVKAIFADAGDASNAAAANALSKSQVVIDASTTLEYPRHASGLENLPRHVSVFITPGGNGAILLAEDKARSVRLQSLEAQYYRALIEEEWGRHHLDGNLSSFWSGASCRDISFVLPYSRVMSHASLLAEQVPAAIARDEASIRVWDGHPDDGTVTPRLVPVRPEQKLAVGDMDLFIDQGVVDGLRALRNANLPNETGGVLLGYYDFNINAIVIVTGLPAPPDSDASTGSFQRGVQGMVDAVTEAARRTAGIVRYIGEWHSHPRGHSARPSRDDLFQLVHLASGMAEDGLPAVQLIVGEDDLQIIQGVMK